MRYDSPIRYLARLWLDVAPMRPTDAVFARARELLRRNDLGTGVGQDAAFGQRPALGDRSGLQIVLPGESFDVATVPTVGDDGRDQPMLSFERFAEQAATYMVAFTQGFEREAYRLALVREGFVAMPTTTMEELPRRVFRVPEPFASHPPFEWDWRLVSRVSRAFGGVEEPLNTAATLKRASGAFLRPVLGTQPFDKVRLDLDISTSHERSNPRFNAGQVEAFFSSCLRWQNELWSQLEQAFQLED